MKERHESDYRRRTDDLLEALERERVAAHELRRRHAEMVHSSREHDRQIFIERRRRPR